MRFCAAICLMICSTIAGCGRRPGGEADGITWVEKGVDRNDVTIDFGYRTPPKSGSRFGGGAVEPVARITRDGVPAADAMVFVSLAAPKGEQNVADEEPTVYEFSQQTADAYYAQALLNPPSDKAECVVKFRIVLPDGENEWTHEVTLPVAKPRSAAPL